jgi:hypothetical protein
MFAILLFATRIVRTTSQHELKVSAKAGLWAGLLLFVVYVISKLPMLREPTFNFRSLPQFDSWPAVVGFAVGFFVLWGVRFSVKTPLVGLVTLVLSAASASALYSYVFLESLRASMLFWALGLAFGTLLHMVFFPKSIGQVWD